MKIVKLQAENIKRLVAVEITPDGALVQLTGANGAGKQQPVSEPVLTPAGWKPIGEILPGDRVIGSNGRPVLVTGRFPQEERSTFAVRMSDGSETRCGPDHLWTVKRWRKGKDLTTETLTTTDLLASGLHTASGSRRFSIPTLSDPVEFADGGMQLPIDPYVLGAVLGDGHIELTGYVSLASNDEEILNALERRTRSAWRGPQEIGTAEWSRPLHHLGLAGKLAADKFIPSLYQWADPIERMRLLHGLMDTDGSAADSWAYFHTSSPQLANDVVCLGRGLGYLCKLLGPKARKYRYRGELKEGLPSYDVLIKSPVPPFSLERKVKAWSPSDQRPRLDRHIEEIEVEQPENSVCISVDATDGLYVTRDFILTHNSSVLDAIWWALAGTAKVQSTPIRKGEQQARITLDLGEIVVIRTFKQVKGEEQGTGYTTLLKVESGDGARYPSPQAVLDRLLGTLAFDPLEFARAKPHQQHRMLATICGIDLEAVVRANKQDYDERRDLNRSAKSHRNAADQIEVPPDTPDEPVSIAGLMEELQAAEEHNRDRGSLTARANDNEREADRCQEESERIDLQLRDLEEQKVGLESRRDRLHQQAGELREAAVDLRKDLPDRKDTDAIQVRILEAEETNSNVEAKRSMLSHIAQAEHQEKRAKALTDQMNNRRDEQAKKIAAAELPVEGLGLTDEVVTLGDLPFDVASDAEQLRVSCALAMRQNAKLKVIRVRDGSLLDESALALLQQMAEEHGYQVWIERVDTSGKVGVYIEAGAVAAVDGEEPPAPEPEREPETEEPPPGTKGTDQETSGGGVDTEPAGDERAAEGLDKGDLPF